MPTRHSAHIFLLKAVMSREALMMRSLRSWCSSSSLRKTSNMGMNGDVTDVSLLGLPSWERFIPAISRLTVFMCSEEMVSSVDNAKDRHLALAAGASRELDDFSASLQGRVALLWTNHHPSQARWKATNQYQWAETASPRPLDVFNIVPHCYQQPQSFLDISKRSFSITTSHPPCPSSSPPPAQFSPSQFSSA